MNIESPGIAEWNYDIGQDILTLSKELRQAVGLGQADGISLEQYLTHVKQEDRKLLADSFKSATENGRLLDVEYRLIDAGGAERWVIQMGIACRGQKEPQGSLRGVLRDITVLKEAAEEASMAKRKVALVEGEVLETKESLKEFTYHTSHDLHAPLRSVIGFSELVMEDYSDKLDARGKDHLGRVISQARHLEEMLDDLLSLSRVMAHPVNWQKVDLSRMASDIAQRDRQSNPDGTFELDIEEGLTCRGDKELMETALDCLMDNAFKFSGGRKNAKIEFGMESVDGEDQYFIRDNGVGFDTNYMDRLFKPFSRLHSSKDFPGNGIGLAIVASVVRKHGGRIWVESTLDEGTTFYFVLGEPPSG